METYKRKSPYKANWLKQFSTVLWRSWISQIHDWMIIVIRLAQIVVSIKCSLPTPQISLSFRFSYC